jgi:hypothetical protein
LNSNFKSDETAQSLSRVFEKKGDDSTATPAAADMSEDQALAALEHGDLTASDLAALARTPCALKSRKVMLALATHPRTPRHSSIPLLRRMFTFDLMQVTLTPAVPADLKRLAEGQILVRLEALSAGEKISLARRASGRVAAELLQDPDSRIVAAALDNSRLTETLLGAALANDNAPQALFNLASAHTTWAQRHDVQIALLRSEKTALDKVRRFANNFSADFLDEILPESTKSALQDRQLGGENPAKESAG